MNCAELAHALRTRLLDERDAHWLLEARRHAEHCSSCSQLLELHQVEEQLTSLGAVEPSGSFVANVMSRVAQLERHPLEPSRRFSLEAWKTPMVVLGALFLTAAYVAPSVGEFWLAGLRPSVGPLRVPLLAAYLATHPLWAIMLGAVAALVVVLALLLPDSPELTNSRRETMAT